MFELQICRICLNSDVRLHRISGSEVQDVFENLTNKVQEDGYLYFACYICYRQLKNCQQLAIKSQRSEELLKQILPIKSELHLSPISLLDRLTHGLIHPLMVTNKESLQIPEYNEFIKTEKQDESDTNEEIAEDGSDVECAPPRNKVKLGETHIIQDDVNSVGSGKTKNIFETETNTAANSNNVSRIVNEEKRTEVLVKKTFICNDCGKTCKTKAVLIKHISGHKPMTIKPNDMNIQHWKSLRKGQYKSKLKENDSSNKNLPYKCKYCKHTCAARSHLKVHIRTHTGEKPFKCQYCSYASAQSGALKTHIRTHTGEKPFKCQYCSYTCRVNSALNRHIRIHTGEKPFKCQYCSYTCTVNSALKIHIRNHTGEKPFKCQFCSYTCTVSSSLKDHIRIHTGEKPFKCQYCSYSCTKSSRLKRHVRIHTKEKPIIM